MKLDVGDKVFVLPGSNPGNYKGTGVVHHVVTPYCYTVTFLEHRSAALTIGTQLPIWVDRLVRLRGPDAVS